MSKNRSGPGGSTSAPIRLAITVVGSWSDSGAYGIPLSVAPVNVGDLMVLFFSSASGAGNLASTVSGGSVTTWKRMSYYRMIGVPTVVTEMWVGVITSAGPSSITITVPGAPASEQIMACELTTGTSPNWTCYGNTGRGWYYTPTTFSWDTPYLTPNPPASNELYLSFVSNGVAAQTMQAGTLTPTAIVYCGGLYANLASFAYAPAINAINNYFGVSGTGVNVTMFNEIASLIYAT